MDRVPVFETGSRGFESCRTGQYIIKLSVMKKLIVIFLAFVITPVLSCEKYVIGFKGLRNVFDTRAFADYAIAQKSCQQLFGHEQDQQAVKFISTLTVPYQLYGFSAGAATIGRILPVLTKQATAMPEYIITIGAYKTTNVNFNSYNIKYDNYFDESGQGQKSPGTMINGVGHAKIQSYVNNYIQ
jgi:hypothetical protein